MKQQEIMFSQIANAAAVFEELEKMGSLEEIKSKTYAEVSPILTSALGTLCQHASSRLADQILLTVDVSRFANCAASYVLDQGPDPKPRLLTLIGYFDAHRLKTLSVSPYRHQGVVVDPTKVEPYSLLLCHSLNYELDKASDIFKYLGIGALNQIVDMGYRLVSIRSHRPVGDTPSYVNLENRFSPSEVGVLNLVFHNPRAHYKLLYFTWDYSVFCKKGQIN